MARYLKTRFARFLVACAALTQDIPRERYVFVPVQDWTRAWTDADLYAKYGLDATEIAWIEDTIRPWPEERETLKERG